MRIKKRRKSIVMVMVWCLMLGNISGCGVGSQGDYLAETNQTEKEHADKMMQSVLDALEAGDAEGLKKLFSTYAQEHAYDLDGKIEELMEFYPGCDGGYEGNVRSHKTTDQGETVYVIMPKYTVKNGEESYQLRLTIYVENSVEDEKIGLYMIQVKTEEDKPDGFKWKDEEDEPGIYVLE